MFRAEQIQSGDVNEDEGAPKALFSKRSISHEPEVKSFESCLHEVLHDIGHDEKGTDKCGEG